MRKLLDLDYTFKSNGSNRQIPEKQQNIHSSQEQIEHLGTSAYDLLNRSFDRDKTNSSKFKKIEIRPIIFSDQLVWPIGARRKLILLGNKAQMPEMGSYGTGSSPAGKHRLTRTWVRASVLLPIITLIWPELENRSRELNFLKHPLKLKSGRVLQDFRVLLLLRSPIQHPQPQHPHS